jgi:RimJ/RimL family protein N-acetyltransferase
MTQIVVYDGLTKSGRRIVVRYPTESDVAEMSRYINALSKEQTFVRFQGERVTLVSEKKFVATLVKKIREHQAVYLGVFCDDKLVGLSGIDMMEKIEKHVGDLGISIASDFRNEGVGTLLMKLMLQEAKRMLPIMRICSLSLFANNPRAKHLYEKFGFIEYGMLPQGIVYKGGYVDHIYMYKVMTT